jgi:hypothetical protein
VRGYPIPPVKSKQSSLDLEPFLPLRRWVNLLIVCSSDSQTALRSTRTSGMWRDIQSFSNIKTELGQPAASSSGEAAGQCSVRSLLSLRMLHMNIQVLRRPEMPPVWRSCFATYMPIR